MMQQIFFWVLFFLKETETNSKRYLYSNVHCSIIHNNKDMENLSVPW